jgi:excisionase family DNA binding protein
MKDKTFLIPLTEEELKELIKSSFREVIDENEPNKQRKELLTFKEVTSLLGVSASTLNNWKRDGKIPFHRIGGRILFKYAEIVESLKNSGNTKLRKLQQGSLYGGVS